MEFRDYLRVLARNWLLIVLLGVLGAAAGGTWSAVQTPVYSATAKAYVSVRTADSVSDLSAGSGYLQQVLASYADIATTAYVLKPVIAAESLDSTPAELAQQVSVTAATNEAILEITVTDTSAEAAASIANAISDQLASTVDGLTPTEGTSAGSVKVTSVDPAVVPTARVNPGPVLLAGLGFAAGAVLALLVGLLRELLDTRVRTTQDLARVTEVPVLGTTTSDPRARRKPLVLLDAPASARAEAFRTLRTNLRFVDIDAVAPSLVVTSTMEREGKSTAASNLALAVARLGERVLLVDADLRRPTIAPLFGLEGGVGLTDVLIGDVELERAVQRFEAGKLDVLPSGSTPPNPNELLQSRAMDGLLERLHQRYDLVVFDSPPVGVVSDAAVLSARAGGALVVCAAGRPRRAQLEAALQSLARADARVVGLVMTMLPGRKAEGYGYGGQAVERAPRRDRGSKRTARTIERERGAW